jgi:hypothetical protein
MRNGLDFTARAYVSRTTIVVRVLNG